MKLRRVVAALILTGTLTLTALPALGAGPGTIPGGPIGSHWDLAGFFGEWWIAVRNWTGPGPDRGHDGEVPGTVEKLGSDIDPDGTSAPTPTVVIELGSDIDPDGQIWTVPALVDLGSDIDPDG